MNVVRYSFFSLTHSLSLSLLPFSLSASLCLAGCLPVQLFFILLFLILKKGKSNFVELFFLIYIQIKPHRQHKPNKFAYSPMVMRVNSIFIASVAAVAAAVAVALVVVVFCCSFPFPSFSHTELW